MIKMKRLLFVALAFGLLVGCSNDTNELSEKAEKETVELQENIEKEKENKLKEVEKVYIGVLESSISVFQDNVDGIRENFVKAEESPIMWIEGDWRMEQKSYFENIALELENLKQLENENAVPEGYEEIHSILIDAFEKNIEAGDILFGGEFSLSSVMDNEKLESGAILFSDSLIRIAEVNEKLKLKQN